MSIQIQSVLQNWFARNKSEPQQSVAAVAQYPHPAAMPAPEIAPNDPIVIYFQSNPGRR